MARSWVALRRAAKRARKRAVARARISLDRRPVAHFLHVGKAAGTAVRLALKEAEGSAHYRVVGHKHEDVLADIPEDDYFFFCVRDPIDRYVSGFLSRQRYGEPRYHVPWNKGETEAFTRFDSPNALAVSLSAGGTEQRDAEAAMRGIRHVKTSYWDWFGDPEYFKSRADHVLWIGHVESLDLGRLVVTLGLERLDLPVDPERANRAVGAKPEMSDLARQNLRQWYAPDYEFLEVCDGLFLEQNPQRRGNPDDRRNVVDRIMSERPFALGNADALRLAQLVRQGKHHPRRTITPTAPHTAVQTHR